MMLHQGKHMEIPATLKDPVCGMDVSTDSKFHFQHNHQHYYFCCQGCEDKFKASPDKSGEIIFTPANSTKYNVANSLTIWALVPE